MGQKKLKRFSELTGFSNVLQYPENMKGNWHKQFGNNHPITLELACGKGEYAVGLGRLFPDRNFLGVDLKGNRIWVGAKKAIAESLTNIAFLRTQIDFIDQYFAPGEVNEIWITFPDPQLRFSKARKRLTHPKFLRKYHAFLKPDALIHLKTDSPQLYHFTKLVTELYHCTIRKDFNDLYAEPDLNAELKIKTHYEQLDIAGSNKVFYLQFSLPASLPGPEKDEELKAILKEHEGAT